MLKSFFAAILVTTALILSLAPAQAEIYHFYPIADGVPTSYYLVTSNLKMTVTEDVAGNSATFLFENLLTGSADGEITEIYFYDGGLLDAVMNIVNDTINNPPKVYFTSTGPGNLPGGNTIGLPSGKSSTFTATREQGGGTPGFGINPAEQLTITFALDPDRTSGVIASLESWAMNAPGFVANDGMLAVGLHLQKMPPFGSAVPQATSSGFVAYGGGAGGLVPLPPSVLLLGSGLLGLAALGWRRKRN